MSLLLKTSRRPQRRGLYRLQPPAPRSTLIHLEQEAIQILWETRAAFSSAALMFSGGKDSACVAHLARKAFTNTAGTTKIPFSFIHYDSGKNFVEVLTYRDELTRALGARLIVMKVPESPQLSTETSTGNIQALIKLINLSVPRYKLKALIGGGRRDEELVRAKERIFSVRSKRGVWDPHDQRPEPWGLYNTHLRRGQHLRVFPISNWTEKNVWQYIVEESVPLPSIYYAHERKVVSRNGTYLSADAVGALRAGEKVETRTVRCRTVGDRATTGFILSDASTPAEVLDELFYSEWSERAGRAEDRGHGTDMESRKRLGWP
jgi:sulfate adenylyltransferase subunit 2